jgi:VCBS repeat-containing protein
MGKEKKMSVAKVGVATSLLVTPFGTTITHADTYNDPTVSWSNVSFVPYLNNDGTVIYDPANEPGISPDDVDFSSGYSKGSGDKPSFYVGSDGANLFFRMRLHGEPYDRKGGFLSSVWLVDIAQNGVHKATVGLNGKSPHEDYIYVTNANGTVLNKINTTDSSGSNVPGSRIVEAENGEYFLDFQVPISRITEIAPSITANSTVQFFFGTSKAANLSVINKDYMGPNTGVSFTNTASVTLNPSISFQIPTITITSTANFESPTPTFTGTTTKAANGSEVTLTLNNKTYKTTVVNGTWSVVIPTGEPLSVGTYPVTAKVINEFNNLAMTKLEVTVGKTITIDGPSTIRVSSFPSTVSGTFTNTTSGSKKVKFTVTNSSGTVVYTSGSLQMDSQKKWSETGIIISPAPTEGIYVIEAVEDIRTNTNLPRAYKTVIIDNQINVAIKTPVNNTSSFNAKPTITGISDPEAKVELFIDGAFYRELKADTLGNWSVELDYALSFGTHTFRAKATDEIGNKKDSLIVNYNVTSLDIDIANGPRFETNDNLPTIRGRSTAPDGSIVTVKISDTLTLKTTVKDGKWSVNVEQPLSDITYYVQATVTSGGLTAQAPLELVIDSTTFVSISSPVKGSVTDNRREPVIGTSEPFATIDVNFDNGKIVGTVFADADGKWTYIPGQDLSIRQHQITVTSSDVNGNNAIATTIFFVNTPGNKVPTVPAAYTTETVKNKSVSGAVVGTDADGDTLTYSKGADPSNGTVVVNPDGTWTYTPKSDYTGPDTFTVVVSDGKGGIATSTITIQVNEPPNQEPTFLDQDLQKTTLKNTPVSGALVGRDGDGDPLTYSKETNPSHGIVVVNVDGTWTYTPTTGYTGPDTFTITVSDGKGGTVTATISIQVNEPPNQAPTIQAKDIQKTTLKNTSVSGAVVGTDADGDTLAYSKGIDPNNGTVVVNPDGTWTYTPKSDYTGPDTFTITVSDGKGGTVTATISIQVNEPPNQAPTIQAKDIQKTTMKNTSVSGAVVGTDADGDTLAYSKGIDPSNGTVVVNVDGTWTYTPTTGYTGPDTFTITVSDGKGGTATATITIQVNEPPNQAPTVLAQDLQKTTLKNTPVSGAVVGTDADGDTLTYSKGTDQSKGMAVVNVDGTWIYTPATGYTGADSFTVKVSDGKGGIATATVTIQVNEQPNQAPTILAQDLQKTTLKNTPVSGAIVGTDADGDDLTFSKGTDPSKGTAVVNVDGTWIYTPATGYTGADSFTVKVSDRKGGIATATVTIQVNEQPNQAPTILAQDLQKTTLKNTPVSGAVVGTDADSDDLTFSKGTDPSNGTVLVNGSGTWTYTPATGYTGADSFTVTVSDGKGGTATATITIQVNEPPNQAPTIQAQDLQKTTLKNTPVSGAVVGTDADGDDLTFNKGTDPSKGTVLVNGDGSWTYTPATGYTGTDSFTVTVSDGKGGTATATITIQVNEPPNQAPTIQAQDLQKTTMKNMSVSGAVVGTDADGDALTYTKGADPSNGSVVVNTDGSWTYTPTTGYTGTDSFTVTVSDGKGGTVTATITIQVNEPPNQAPTIQAQDLQKTTLKNTPVSGAVVGTDADGDALTFMKGTDPSNGTVLVNGDGSWTYTPATGYTGTDSFTVTVSDGEGGTAAATITIQVNEPPNQAPTIQAKDLQKTTLKNTSVSGALVGTDPDGDALTFTKGTNPSNGTVLVNGDGSWTYTPAAGYTGTDSFTVTVSDGKGGTATATITIQVNEPPNQAPTIQAQDLQKTTLKNTSVSGAVVGTDTDGDALTFTKGTDPSNGTVVVNGDGTWTYTPTTGYTGTDSFTITVSDGKGGTATATITIQVNELPNQAPTIQAQDLQKTTLKHTPVSGAVVGTDADGDALTFTKGTDTINGTVVVNGDGTWTYTPAAGYTGTDSFTVTVSDGKGGTATATITIQVNEPPNQAPTIQAQDLQKATLKNTPVSGSVIATDTDGDTLTYTKGNNPSHGTVVVNGNGAWTYTPSTSYTGTDIFTVTVSDGKGGTATATITIQVNEPPTQEPPAIIYSVDIDGGDRRTIVDRIPLINGTALASDFSSVTVELMDKNGKVVERGVVSVVSGKWSYQTANLLNPETYTVVARLKDPTGTGEYNDQQQLVIEEADMFIQMNASPAAIVGDGKTRAIITAVIKDAEGKLIVGEKVTFTAEAGTLTKTEAITNSRGEAVVELISPDLSGTVEAIQKLVKASVANPDKGLFGEDQIVIQFLPASISGVIIDSDTGKPIPGAFIEVKEDFNKDGVIDFSASIITDSEGKYTVAVPYANWNYQLVITTTRKIADKTYPIEFIQNAKVGQTTGKGESFKSESTVSGQLFMMNKETNTADKINSVLDGVGIKPTVLNDPSGSLKVTVDASGKFQITGGEKGKTYQVVFNLQVKDTNGNQHVLVGHQVSVFIPDEGIASVQAVLIDPFGIVSDDVTGLPISGVKAQLYWADTELNRSKGRTPNTLVNLPILEGFAPSDNRVPQFTDKFGAYAWMVFPDGDYYIVAEKEGYATFDSRTEGRDVPKIGEDSYILDGVIHVGQSIVEFNFSMTALKGPVANPNPNNLAPTIGDYQFKVGMNQTLKQKVVGTDPEKAPLTYGKRTEPKHGTVIVKEDGTFTYTPAPGFVGTDKFTMDVIDDHGEKSSSVVTIVVEKKESSSVNGKVLIETFINRTISGDLTDIHVINPVSIQVKSPNRGTVHIQLENSTWSYTPDDDFVGKDYFTVYYYDGRGVLYTQVVDVIVHPKTVNIDNKPIDTSVSPDKPVNSDSTIDADTHVGNSENSMNELPKTGSLLDRNILLGAASLLTTLGLALRRFGRRKEDN